MKKTMMDNSLSMEEKYVSPELKNIEVLTAEDMLLD